MKNEREIGRIGYVLDWIGLDWVGLDWIGLRSNEMQWVTKRGFEDER